MIPSISSFSFCNSQPPPSRSRRTSTHPWGNPTLAMLEWAMRVIKVRPAPDGEVAFDELCESMGIDVS